MRTSNNLDLPTQLKARTRLKFAALMLTVSALLGGCSPQARLGAGGSTDSDNQPGQKSASFKAQVIRVTDGDSLLVRDASGRTYRIRVAGIDAPEGRQAYGSQSSEHLRRLLNEPAVTIKSNKTDRYGRLIAKVSAQGIDIGLAQIKSGSAWFYRYYQREQTPVDRRTYGAAERSARRAQLGLWRQSNPVEPWDFRRLKRAKRKN